MVPRNSVPNFSMSHSSNTFRSSLYILTFSHCVSSTLYCFATRAYLCMFFLLLSTTGVPLSSLWQVQAPCTKSQFQRFRVVHWAVRTRFHFCFCYQPPVYLQVFLPLSPCFLVLAFPLVLSFLSFSLFFPCSSQASLWTGSVVVGRMRCRGLLV